MNCWLIFTNTETLSACEVGKLHVEGAWSSEWYSLFDCCPTCEAVVAESRTREHELRNRRELSPAMRDALRQYEE